MKSHIRNSLLLLLLASAVASADSSSLVEHRELDEDSVQIIPVSRKRVTTIGFPGPIEGMDGAFLTIDGKTPGMFHLAHTPGTAFFSARALLDGVETNLNVRWQNKTYVLVLRESQTPVLSLIFSKPQAPRPSGQRLTTPALLLGLLDKAKAYPFLLKHHPKAVEEVGFRAYPADDKQALFDYGHFEIQLKEAYRFDPQDTLIFHLQLRNKSDREIRYAPDGFQVRVGQNRYPQSLSDASGTIPPGAEESAWIAITGSPDGSRNELSLKNDFTIIPERIGDRPATEAADEEEVSP